MKHVIVTRISFVDNKRFEEYLPVIRSVYIPCILSQTCKNFAVCLIVREPHKQLLSCEFSKVGIPVVFVIGNVPSYNESDVKFQYDIQTRHDCDDWMHPNYIEKIQSMYFENIGKHAEFLVNAQPTKIEHATGKEYHMPPYPSSRPSMFLSLCQREPSKSIMQEQHVNFSTIVPTVLHLESGFVKWVIHGNNITGKICIYDKKL